MGLSEWGMLVLLSLFWGGSFFFVEIALKEFPFFTLVFLRVAIAALILLIVVYITKQRMPSSPKIWSAFFAIAVLNNVIPFSAIAWGQKYISSGVASILNATTPIFTILLAHLLTKDERIKPKKIFGAIFGFIGVYVLMKPELQNGFSLNSLGQFAVLSAAISYSFAGIFGKKLKQVSPIISSAGMLTCSSIVMLPIVTFLDTPWILKPSLQTWIAVISLAVISTAIAYLLYFRILRTAGATNVMLVTFLIPVSAILFGVGLLGETIDIEAYVGMGFIFFGLILIDGRIIKNIRKIYRK